MFTNRPFEKLPFKPEKDEERKSEAACYLQNDRLFN